MPVQDEVWVPVWEIWCKGSEYIEWRLGPWKVHTWNPGTPEASTGVSLGYSAVANYRGKRGPRSAMEYVERQVRKSIDAGWLVNPAMARTRIRKRVTR